MRMATTTVQPAAAHADRMDRPALGMTIRRAGGWMITATLAIIFLWFGSMKFVPSQAETLVGIISNNPLISWLYTLLGYKAARASWACSRSSRAC